MAEAGVEILCVGTELLLGDILNGNARWIAQRLAALGLPHFRQTVVGDNRHRLALAAQEASQRCRVLITTGGLGPTPDDLTTKLWPRLSARRLRNGLICGRTSRPSCPLEVALSRRATDARHASPSVPKCCPIPLDRLPG